MAEVDYSKIRAIYRSFVALLKSVDQSSGYSINAAVGSNYDHQIDELTSIARNDYSTYKASVNLKLERFDDGDKYLAREFHQLLSQIVGLLDGQFEFEKPQVSVAPIITIDNSNRNEIHIKFKSVLQVADEVDDLSVKDQLIELDRELNKPTKDLEKIRSVLVWLMQRSWEVFLSVAPVLLEKLGKNF
jgi:hypothetical protein